MKTEEHYPTYQALVNPNAKGGGAEVLVVVEREGAKIRFHSRGMTVEEAFGNINYNMNVAYRDIQEIKSDLSRIRREKDYVETDQPINPSKMSNFQRDALKDWSIQKLLAQEIHNHRMTLIGDKLMNDEPEKLLEYTTNMVLRIRQFTLNPTQETIARRLIGEAGTEAMKQLNVLPSKYKPLLTAVSRLILFVEDIAEERGNYNG